MEDLPGGFGIETGIISAVGTSKTARTRPHKKDKQKTKANTKVQVIIDLEKEKKRKAEKSTATPEDASSKKQKTNPSTFSLVSSTLSPLAIPFVKDDEIVKWRNRNPIEENEALIKASAELLVSSLRRQSTLQREEARLDSLEREKEKLAKKVEDRDRVIEILKNELQSKERFYESQLKTQEEVASGLSSTIDSLREEKQKLSEGWELEKKKIEKSAFRDGFKNYASGFLAQDPDYDFTRFGEETVAWIAKFKVEEAASIKAKRVLLGLEEASPVPEEDAEASEDASSGKEDDASKVNDTARNASPPPAQDAP